MRGKVGVLALALVTLLTWMALPASSVRASDPVLDLHGGWQFRLDPDDVGITQGWYTSAHAFQAQRTVNTGQDLTSQGVPDYKGVSWYRQTVTLPVGWRQTLLGFGGLDVACELFVNGKLIGHWDDATLGDRAAVVDLTSLAAPGHSLSLVFRVTGTGGFGGIKQDVRLGPRPEDVMTGEQYLLWLQATHPDWRLPLAGSDRGWVVTGVEGGVAEAVVAKDGSFSPRASGYGITFWLYDLRQRQLVAFPPPTATLGDGSSPVPMFTFSAGLWQLREELGSSGPPSAPAMTAQVTVSGPNDAWVYAALRPYTASGGSAAVTSTQASGGQLWANGQLALACVACLSVDGGALVGQDASAVALAGQLPAGSTATDAHGEAQAVLRASIQPGHSLTFVAPSTPTQQAPTPADLGQLSAAWQQRLHAVQLRLPDAQLQDAFYASLGYILVEQRGGRIHPGPLLHDNFWVRDGAMIGYALDRAGLADAVKGTAEETWTSIAPDGRVAAETDSAGHVVAADELDAPGEAAFGLAEYARFSGDRAFLARAYPALALALQTAMAGRDADGLVPPNRSAEDLGPSNQHHHWDDLWLLTGLQEGSWAAQQLGKPDDAQAFDTMAGQLRTSLLASVAATGKPFIPNGPEDTDSPAMARGSSPALWPLRVLDPQSALVRDSFQTYYQRFVQPNGGAYHHLYGLWWPYGGLELAHDFLFLGMRQPMQQVLDYTMAHQTAPGLFAWAEGVDPASGGFGEGDMPHGWAAAELVNLVRDMLLYEDGSRLVVGAGVPTSWQGKAFSATNMPTQWGRATVSVSADGVVTVSGVNPPGGVALALPFPARLA